MLSSPALKTLLKDFAQNLRVNKYSQSTVKNYKSDLKIFLSWFQKNTPQKDLFSSSLSQVFTPRLIKDYQKQYLARKYDKKTAIRRLAGLKVFCQYAQKKTLIHGNPFSALPSSFTSSLASTNQKPAPILEAWQKDLQKKGKSPHTIKNYASDLRHFFAWANLKNGS